MRKLSFIVLQCLFFFSLGAAEEPAFYSSALYRADFRVELGMRSVRLDIGGRKLLLGHRVETQGAGINPSMARAKNDLSHSFARLSDGLKYVYESSLEMWKTNVVMGTVRQSFTFRPSEIVYEVTLIPEGSWPFGALEVPFASLVWALDATQFQDVTFKVQARNGTSAMNLVDFASGTFHEKTWMPRLSDVVRIDWATAEEHVAVAQCSENVALNLIRYGARGESLGLSVFCRKAVDSGWEYVFDKPVTFAVKFEIQRWK